MIAVSKTACELRRSWRRQIVAQRNPLHGAARKGFAAVTFLDKANSSSIFIEINNLLVVLVHEVDSHCHDRTSLRLSGYNVRRIPHGVQWGGADNCQLLKNLALAPQYGARGQRVDRSKHKLLALALQLDRRVIRGARHPTAPWPKLRLPQLWAGFRAGQSALLRGEGPEFEQACRKQGRAASDLFRESARAIAGLTAHPLDWVSEQVDAAVAIFAEVTLDLKRQVCRIGDLPEGLIGFQGASAFDFYNH